MTSPRLRTNPRVAFVVLLVLAASAPAASAADITTDRACYRVGGPVSVSLTGMPAGETVDVRVDDDVAAEVVIDAAGSGTASVTAPRGRPPRAIKLRAQVSLQILSEAFFRVGIPVVEMSPTSAKPSTRVTYSLTGFSASGSIYAHVARGGKLLRSINLGAPATPCAELRARIPQLPLSRPAKGLYTVQFDQQRVFKARRPGSVSRSVRVRFAPRQG